MKTIHKSVLLTHSAAEMFALVTDVARYPEFLPWCSESAVLEQTEAGMLARVGMSLGGLRPRVAAALAYRAPAPGRVGRVWLIAGFRTEGSGDQGTT